MRILKILIVVSLSLLLTACGATSSTGTGVTNANTGQKVEITPKAPKNSTTAPALGKVEISFDFNRSFKRASDQLAVWVEDEQGRHIRTLLVTKFTADGGYLKRPESVPNWQKAFLPGQAARDVIDAFTSATPQSSRISVIWDCLDQNGKAVAAGHYIYKVEANIEWQKLDLWQGDITVGTAPSEVPARTVEGDSSKLQAVKATFTPFH